MDTKLARGLTRDGFRRDLAALDDAQQALWNVHNPYIEKMLSCGKLSKAEVAQALARLAAFKSNKHHCLFLERFHAPAAKALSANADGALVGGNFSSGSISLFDHEEMVRSYSLFYDRYWKKGIDLRLMERPLYLREHAVSRFIERQGAPFSSITPSVWPGLLLTDAVEYFLPVAIARPVMLPLPEGAFLGLATLGAPPSDIRGVERTLYTGQGPAETVDRSSVERFVPIWFMSTFVPLEQLKAPQRELREALLAYIERHRAVLMVTHLARIMSLGEESDGLGLETRFPGDVHAAKADFEALAASALWLRGTRVPNDTPFVNLFVAQGLLERSSIDATH